MKRKLSILIGLGVMLVAVAVQAKNDNAAKPETAPPAAAAPAEAAAPAPADKAAADKAAADKAAADVEAANEVLPLVAIEDAALPEAIKTLARLANINCQFDPKVFPGPPDPATGKPKPQPVVSFRWENVTALQAMRALLENHDLQLSEDPATKIARVTIKDPATLEPLVTEIIQLNHTPPTTNLVQLLKPMQTPTRGQIMMDARTSQIIVMSTAKDLEKIKEVLKRLDQPGKQVLIEARIMETSANPKAIRGIDWSGTLDSHQLTFGNGRTDGVTTKTTGPSTVTLPGGREVTGTSDTFTTETTTALGQGKISLNTKEGFFPRTAFLDSDGLSVAVSFLNTEAETESIAMPRAVAMDGQPTELAVVRNVPVFEEQQSSGAVGSQALATVKPNYELRVGDAILNEVGIKLHVLPRILGLTNILLELRPEISATEPLPERKVLGGKVNESPVFSRRKINTQAVVPSGHTLVLGGLDSDGTSKTFTKVPILGDLPGLGLLFRKDGKQRNRTTLLIFITPTIVGNEDYQPTFSKFMQTEFEEKSYAQDNPMDSGHPKDWSKVKSKKTTKK